MIEQEKKLCECGAEISRWSRRCLSCQEKAIIAAATVVKPSDPLVIVGTDTFFQGLSEAVEEYPGRHAHPCDLEPLKVNSKRLAEYLAERVVEDMCEEAFEDAASYVNGENDLREAFEAALDKFNDAQTANSWVPRTNEVFVIPEKYA